MIARQTRLESHRKDLLDAYCDRLCITRTSFFNEALHDFLKNDNNTALMRAVPRDSPVVYLNFDEGLMDGLRSLMTLHSVSLSSVLYTAICKHAQAKGVFQ